MEKMFCLGLALGALGGALAVDKRLECFERKKRDRD